MLSTDEYSDLNYAGPFVVLKPFDIQQIGKQVSVLPVLSESIYRKKNGPDEVIQYLLDNSFITKVECRNFHLGSYGDINITGDFDE